MSEFDKEEVNNESEIDQIQKEIDKALNTSLWDEVKPEAPISVTPAAPLPSGQPLPGVPLSAQSESFYKEVIKNEGRIRKNRFKRSMAIACAVSILGGVSLGAGIGVGVPVANNVIIPRMLGESKVYMNAEPNEPFAFPQEASAEGLPANEFRNIVLYDDNLSEIVGIVEPSVVGVTTKVPVTSESYFFSIPQRDVETSASGIIFHQDQDSVYIVTNYHVIGGANSVSISVSGSEPVSARLIGSDGAADLAVIAIYKQDLSTVGISAVTVATFGDSDNVKVGESVLAIGNALGEGNTATRGIISAKNKEIATQGNIKLTVLQTDAAINPGNSGGPLINTKGEVVGINTAKISESTVEGTGYSITSNVAKAIIEEIMNQKSKAYLGVRMSNLSQEYAQMYNLPTMGVVIEEVFEGSSAYHAGIKRYDIITGFNDMPILTMEDLSACVKQCEIGDEVEIKLYRDGQKAMTVKVKMMPYPESAGF